MLYSTLERETTPADVVRTISVSFTETEAEVTPPDPSWPTRRTTFPPTISSSTRRSLFCAKAMVTEGSDDETDWPATRPSLARSPGVESTSSRERPKPSLC